MKFKVLAASLALIGSALYAESRPHLFQQAERQPKSNHILKEGEHELRGKSGDGIIEFENGAQFKAVSDPARILTWDFYDHITITPNPYPFRNAPYYAINVTKGGDYVSVDFWMSPSINSSATDFLWNIDPTSKEIILQNNSKVKTRWQVDEEDFEELHKYWQRGDTVLIGKNDGWFTCLSNYKYILISYKATENTLYIRATPKPL